MRYEFVILRDMVLMGCINTPYHGRTQPSGSRAGGGGGEEEFC